MTIQLKAPLYIAVLLLLAIPAFAGQIAPGTPVPPDPFTITFDENGNSTTCIYGGGCSATPFQVGVDPNTGVTTLIYQLPEFVGGGGANILDPLGSISDALDFFAGTDTSFMAFYSFDSSGSLADVGSRPIDFGFTGGTEGADGTFSFVAGGGDPSSTNFYDGTSPSSTPEPGSLGLLGAGLVLLGGLSRRVRHG